MGRHAPIPWTNLLQEETARCRLNSSPTPCPNTVDKSAPGVLSRRVGCHPDKSALGGQQHARHRAAGQRTTVSTAETPSRRTLTSRAFWGTGLSVETPPGQRTFKTLGASVNAITSVLESCDPYPPPAWISRAGPKRPSRPDRTWAPMADGLSAPPSNRTFKPGRPPVFRNRRVAPRF